MYLSKILVLIVQNPYIYINIYIYIYVMHHQSIVDPIFP